MKILITGVKGFIGRNLVAELKNHSNYQIFECDRDTEADTFDFYCKNANFVIHLAGINRPLNQSEFMFGNFGYTLRLIETLKKHKNHCPIICSSSIQAELTNPYGVSKKAEEDVLLNYSKETGAETFIFRLPNVFGKWCKPNYNSVVATFCYNIARDLPIQINDSSTIMNLVYIDDVIAEFLKIITENRHQITGFCEISKKYSKTLGEIAELINSFKKCRKENSLPDMSDGFIKKLYSTYLSYLPKNDFSYLLKMHIDNRGSFTEFLKTSDRGQVSINISKPGITKGNHWHHTKNEKFLVVSGKGVIRFRDVNSAEIIEYYVSGGTLEVVDIPVGYTHNIENLGDTDMVTIMWANESFNPHMPDTYHLEV